MGAVPQLDFSTYPSQVFWFACAFLLLYLAVRWAVPRIESAIGRRHAAASRSLESASDVCRAIELRLHEQRKALDNADLRARDMVKKALAEVASGIEEARFLLDEEVEAILKETRKRAEELERNARGELIDLSAEVAFMYYTKIRGRCGEKKRTRLKGLASRLYEGEL
ncbi:ATP synthase subunit B family protein [Anaplasma capra]|uniref:hypothetical protein n=1 Tax=Anaplasma capra TaxID=1562740 RepID=UPI0021D5DD71|nr:hypothetical protein [Anaplasma capra]MCU7611299.1 hypothetical protein [Anaplasma capra]MCU7612748.1 hypothetical protein [Anaplasma capra]